MHDVDAHTHDDQRYDEHLTRLYGFVEQWGEEQIQAYEDEDPKSPGYYEAMSWVWDNREKCK